MKAKKLTVLKACIAGAGYFRAFIKERHMNSAVKDSFPVLFSKHQNNIKKLKKLYTLTQAKELLTAFTVRELQCLKPLASWDYRGNLNNHDINEIIEVHAHFALSLMIQAVPSALSGLEVELAEKRSRRDRLKRFSKKIESASLG